jgi:3-phosphoshikimate 1-carboxyvinyltransferase
METLEIRPLPGPPDTVVRVPGSKSITNRALLIAALAEGESELNGVLFSDDTRYMTAALRDLGIEVECDEAAARVRVAGRSGEWPVKEADLFVGNAGTTMRFLLAALCLGHGHYRIDGAPRMRERPIQDLVDALTQLGARVRCEQDTGCPPVVVDAAGLDGGSTEVRGDRSSQFLSALLQVAPYAAKDVTVQVCGPLIARPYVEMTAGVMAAFGGRVDRAGDSQYRVSAGRPYRARRFEVEPDASSAHYFLAAAALTAGRVRVEGLGRKSLQGDVRFAELLATMGAEVHWEDDAIEVIGPEQLGGIDVDLNELSDTAPTLAVLGAFTSGTVRIRNVAHLRWQESDRLHAVATELRRLGVAVEELSDGLIVHPSKVGAGRVETYDDHRIAMSFALLGLKVPGIVIEDPACVSKTFPDYFERLEALRG